MIAIHSRTLRPPPKREPLGFEARNPQLDRSVPERNILWLLGTHEGAPFCNC